MTTGVQTVRNSTCNLGLDFAFCVRETDISAIHEVLSKRIGHVRSSVACSDNVTRTFDKLGELLAFQNTPNRSIKTVTLDSRSEDYDQRAQVEFNGKLRWRQTLSLRVDAKDEITSSLREEVGDILFGTRQWYTALHRIDFSSVMIYTLVALFALGWILVGSGPTGHSESRAAAVSSDGVTTRLYLVAVLVALFILAFGANKLRDKVFPKAAFAHGQGKECFQTLEKVQWGIVIALVVSIVASVTVTAVQAWI